MLMILGAIALGVVIGLLLGGSLTKLADVQFRWWPLAIGGLALQLIPIPSMRGQIDHWLDAREHPRSQAGLRARVFSGGDPARSERRRQASSGPVQRLARPAVGRAARRPPGSERVQRGRRGGDGGDRLGVGWSDQGAV